MAFPVTLNGRTYTLADFEGTNYVDGFPDALEDFVTQAGDIYNDTSSTSEAIGTGSKTFTVSEGKPYQEGTPLRIADASSPEINFLDCVVTSYSGTSLTVNAFGFAGSGTYSSWTINIGGAKTVDGTLAVNQGGTGSTSASGARTNLGLGSIATQDADNVNLEGGSITGTDIDISGATFTVANNQISGDAINGGTISGTNVDVSGSTFTVANGQVSGSALQDNSVSGNKIISVNYDNSTSGLEATNVQGAIDEAVESFVGRKEQIAQGFIQREGTRGDLDVDLAVAIELNLLGAPVAGGFYAGLIDTIAGTIDSQDDYQTGLRYALIVAPKSLEGGRGSAPASGLPTGDLEWDTQSRGGEAGCFTRWNGLEATNVIIGKGDSSYEVHDFIEACRLQYPAVSTPGGSAWYLPAMDELELLYRNFKPNNADNRDDTRNRNFPGTQVVGTNPSSAIEGFQYENSPRIPDVTYLDLFKENAAQSLDQLRYWSTTDADEGGRAWVQGFTNSGNEGIQFAVSKDNSSNSVRPVRRVVL